MSNPRPQKRKRPSFHVGNSGRKCCERPVSYTPLPRSVCGYHRPAYGPPRNERPKRPPQLAARPEKSLLHGAVLPPVGLRRELGPRLYAAQKSGASRTRQPRTANLGTRGAAARPPRPKGLLTRRDDPCDFRHTGTAAVLASSTWWAVATILGQSTWSWKRLPPLKVPVRCDLAFGHRLNASWGSAHSLLADARAMLKNILPGESFARLGCRLFPHQLDEHSLGFWHAARADQAVILPQFMHLRVPASSGAGPRSS
jgi:hypothetical protein